MVEMGGSLAESIWVEEGPTPQPARITAKTNKVAAIAERMRRRWRAVR